MEQSKPPEVIDVWEHLPWSGIVLTEEKSKNIFKENRTGLLQLHFKTHRRMMVMQEMISGQFQGTVFTFITLRVKLYVPREESFPIPQRYIYVTRATSTTLDVMLESRIDDFWKIVDGFHTVHNTERKASFHGPVRSWQRSNQHPGPITCGQRCRKTFQMQLNEKKKKEQEWAIGKPKFDGARRLRCTSLIQQTRSSRNYSKMRLESWKFRCQQQCFARPGEENTGNL